MKVIFIKQYKNARGRIFKKGAEEGLTRDIAIKLIKSRYCKEVEEFVETGIIDKKGNQILKKK